MQKNTMSRSKGFSLVELSIVLVILGLLVGGVLSGQALIQAAELRSIVTDRDKYTAAFNTFKAKYNSLPGDFSRATAIWGAVDPTPATCVTTARTSLATCDGNGDGIIATYSSWEMPLAWEHLSLSKIIEGSYVGYTSGATAGDTVLSGITAPKSRYKTGVWSIIDGAGLTNSGAVGSYSVWKGKYGHNLLLASRPYPLGNGAPSDWLGARGLLTAESASNIDAKADDGKPGTGSIRTFEYPNSAGECTSSVTYTDYFTATYATENASPYCKLLFDLGM